MHNRRDRKLHTGSRGGLFGSALQPLTESVQSAAAAKQKGARKLESRKAFGSDKENAGQHHPKPSSDKSLPGYLRATKSSQSKTGPSEDWSHTMEDQLHSLQGDFAALKRDSVRLSLAGTENAPPGIVAQSPAPASIAARLSALKRESFQAVDNPLSAAGDTPLRDLNVSRGSMLATCNSLMPTSRENLRLTGVPDQRMSMSEIDPFEAAGQWEAPSLAQVAEELFSDATFAEMCERGLTMQLKRTKDGATAETRIAELAGRKADGRLPAQALAPDLLKHQCCRHVAQPTDFTAQDQDLHCARYCCYKHGYGGRQHVDLCRTGEAAAEVPDTDVLQDPLLH